MKASAPFRSASTALVLFGTCVLVYSLSHYGGVRSPDGEVYYLTAEALADRASFAVRGELDLWPGFGLAPGVDGRRYSIFAPGLPLAAAPIIWAAKRTPLSDWVERTQRDVPPSFYTGNGLATFLSSAPPRARGAWAIRSAAACLNIFVTAFCVCLLFWTLRSLELSAESAYLAAALFGLGTLAWPYAGMFLSEPLATATALGSLFFLVRSSRGAREPPPVRDAWAAGVCLGLSVATHVSSLCFAPFFFALTLPISRASLRWRWQAPSAFVAGLAVPVALLALHQYARFGNPLETGRSVDLALRIRYGYGEFTAPWQGLLGLLVSPAKGLLLYSPAVVLGAAAWPLLHRSQRRLSQVLLAAIAFRIGFLAFRSDWPGGFCLGPRYLVPVLPLLMIPCAVWLERNLRARNRRALALGCLAGFLCVAQQLYFAIGEVVSLFHYQNYALRSSPQAVSPWGIYFDWDFAPLTRIWQVRRGPFWMQDLETSNGALFLAGLALLATVFGLRVALSGDAARRASTGRTP